MLDSAETCRDCGAVAMVGKWRAFHLVGNHPPIPGQGPWVVSSWSAWVGTDQKVISSRALSVVVLVIQQFDLINALWCCLKLSWELVELKRFIP